MKSRNIQKAEGTPQEPLEGEQEVFLRRPQLRRRYRGKFVALYKGRVMGHGPDDEELAREMFEKLGDVPFYIDKVEREPTIYELPSPELIP